VLIALPDADHSLHARTTQWLGRNASGGWASCPITENGCVRIMSHPGYPHPLPVRSVIERLAAASGLFVTPDTSISREAVIGARKSHVLVP
jgi:hypothetical protein